MEDVINEVRELFLDEGVDEQVLMELKTVSEGIKPGHLSEQCVKYSYRIS